MNPEENQDNVWIRKAQIIALAIHEDQKRSDGRPYVEHLAQVAAKVNDRLKPIAWLHDTIEDHPDKISLDDLRKEGFPSYIVDAVDLLTHKKGVSNMEYWKQILTNQDAVAVKLRDIEDNMGDNPSEHAKIKYAKALDLFKKAGHSL